MGQPEGGVDYISVILISITITDIQKPGMVYNYGNSHDLWHSKIPLTPFTRGNLAIPNSLRGFSDFQLLKGESHFPPCKGG